MSKQISLDNLWKLSHLFFIFLIILTLVYAVERVCYIDSAYMLFRMINQESIVAEGGRWMNVLPQIIPWVIIKMGMPLKVVILCFSAMYMLILYGVFLLIGNFFNQKLTGILFFLLLILSVNETFFDVVTETRHSLAFGALFLSFLLSDKNNSFFTGLVVIFFGFFSHPVFLIYFLVILIFCRLFNTEINIVKYLFTGTIVFIVKYLIIGSTTYENNLISDAFINLQTTFYSSFIHHYFSGLMNTQFVFLMCFFFILIYQLIKDQKYIQLVSYIVSILMTYFLLAIVYSKGDSQMMIQKTLIIFHFIMVLPLLFYWPKIIPLLQKVLLILILFSFIFAFKGIIHSADKYVGRIEVLKHFMKNLPDNSDKFLIRESQINHERLLATWALPHETIILSSLYLKKNLSIKNYRERNDTLLLCKFPTSFRPAFGYPVENKNLNSQYFLLDESKAVSWLDSTLILGKKDQDYNY